MGVDSQAACLVDGPADDYESWDGELAKGFLGDETVLYVDDLRFLKVEWLLHPMQAVPD